MIQNGIIKAICISEKKGTEKFTIKEAIVNQLGIVNDAHAGDWHRQISLLSAEEVDKFNSNNPQVNIVDGAFGENILLEGIDLCKTQIGDKIVIGSVELEVTQIGKECHGDGCTIFQAVGKCIMPKVGIFAKVLKTGTIKTGDKVNYKSI
ncbi:MAG: MOSC domain-containing protein [Candidatus Delongbacteria bacterium]|jgi:MOSC domain-containing protein YiiM|nr:MOSC domain-containing protein [Candidatus Delongbacteria bacterium]